MQSIMMSWQGVRCFLDRNEEVDVMRRLMCRVVGLVLFVLVGILFVSSIIVVIDF